MRCLNDYVYITKSNGCHRYLHWGEQNLLKQDLDSGWSGLSYGYEKPESLTFSFERNVSVAKLTLYSCIGRLQKSSPSYISIKTKGENNFSGFYEWHSSESFSISFDKKLTFSELTMELSGEPLRAEGKYFKQLNRIIFLGDIND